jgi:Ti-type conjugative transfer relaxase TraA
MAIYHLHAQIIGRRGGRSAVASAAYRHCARMEIEAEARFADYSRKSGLAHSEFALPQETPAWLRELVNGRDASGASSALWNAVEAFEKREDAQFMREMDLALPVELDRQQNIELVRAFVAEQILPRGMVADWAYHDMPGNPHVHLMTTLRPLTEDGFGPKKVAIVDGVGRPLRIRSRRFPNGKIVYRQWAGDEKLLNDWRASWAALQNRHLAQQGLDISLDHRSFEEQGIGLAPTVKIGVGTKRIARKGERNESEVELDRLRIFEQQRQDAAKRIVHRPEIILDMISRERSVFSEWDLARLVHRYVDDPATLSNVQERLMTSPELVSLQAASFDFERGANVPAKLATRSMIRTEAEMARQAIHLATQDSFPVSAAGLKATFLKHHHLHDEQRAAIEYVTGASRIAAVVGLAGAGKTTALKAAREAWECSGYRVVGGALAGKAAEGLEKEAGIASRTLSSWALHWGGNREPIDDRTVFVLDEAGMVASREMARIVDQVSRAGAKLVLVGDGEQLQPIEAGAAFRAIHDKTGYVLLETVRRQKHAWMRRASVAFAQGRTAEAISAYQARGKILDSPSKTEAIKSLVADWSRSYDARKSTLILAHLRRDVRTLNKQARLALIERGLLADSTRFQTEHGPRDFAVGDQIVFLRNENSLGVKNGMIGRVVEARTGKLVVEAGEDKRRVEVAQAFYCEIDHGYATTIHKAQGATVDRVKVLGSLSLDKHLSYVAMTRHREDVAFYYGRRSFDRAGGIDELLSRRAVKETTLDYVGSREYFAALRYASNRGLRTFRVARALLDDQLRFIARTREKVAGLAGKLAALAPTVSRQSAAAIAAQGVSSLSMVERAVAVTSDAVEPLLVGMTGWSQPIDEVVSENVASSAALRQQWREISDRFGQVYQDPNAAANAIKIDALVEAPEGCGAVLDQLETNPESFGRLRGRSGLASLKASRRERQLAVEGGAVLKVEIERYIRLRSWASARLEARETDKRWRASIDLPAVSQAATRAIERARGAIDQNDLPGALGAALADRGVKAEIDRLTTALDRRFGERALLGPDARTIYGPVYKALAAEMPSAQKLKLAEVWPMLRAVQQLAAYERSLQALREAETAKLARGSSVKPEL